MKSSSLKKVTLVQLEALQIMQLTSWHWLVINGRKVISNGFPTSVQHSIAQIIPSFDSPPIYSLTSNNMPLPLSANTRLAVEIHTNNTSYQLCSYSSVGVTQIQWIPIQYTVDPLQKERLVSVHEQSKITLCPTQERGVANPGYQVLTYLSSLL